MSANELKLKGCLQALDFSANILIDTDDAGDTYGYIENPEEVIQAILGVEQKANDSALREIRSALESISKTEFHFDDWQAWIPRKAKQALTTLDRLLEK